MRTLLAALAAVVTLYAPASFADQFVNGYMRRDGTYVQPHMRSSPDSNPFNNYSTRGNTNPYTGAPGTHDPYRNNSFGSAPSFGSGTGLNYPTGGSGLNYR